MQPDCAAKPSPGRSSAALGPWASAAGVSSPALRDLKVLNEWVFAHLQH